MVYEYAVEPALASTWYDRKQCLHILDKFGIERGRVVSRYPKHWKRLVWEAFRGSGAIERKRLEEILARLSETMAVRQATQETYDERRSWLENAEVEHSRSPFRAILARANPRERREVLTADTLDETSEPLWAVKAGMSVPRQPTDLAAAVAPMLRCASKIIFVDPHFAPTRPRFMRTMEAFFEATFDGRPAPDPNRIEIHVSDEMAAKYFIDQCKVRLPQIIPNGVQVGIVCWRQRPGGEKLHNRYILTDLGGVQLGIGLDDADGEPGQTDDLNRLGREQFALRWAQYGGLNPGFELQGKATIVGTRPGTHPRQPSADRNRNGEGSS